jgi:hypothetical protein
MKKNKEMNTKTQMINIDLPEEQLREQFGFTDEEIELRNKLLEDCKELENLHSLVEGEWETLQEDALKFDQLKSKVNSSMLDLQNKINQSRNKNYAPVMQSDQDTNTNEDAGMVYHQFTLVFGHKSVSFVLSNMNVKRLKKSISLMSITMLYIVGNKLLGVDITGLYLLNLLIGVALACDLSQLTIGIIEILRQR